MVSRYPDIKVVDYCYHPRHIVKEDRDIIVPCNKCDGCLLHMANEWSMRCGMEIEGSPATIFGTLTYSNKYLPRLVPLSMVRMVPSGNVNMFGDPLNFPCDLSLDYNFVWTSNHPDNIRFNSVIDVLRDDFIFVDKNYQSIPISNFDNDNNPSIAYASKRDVQLWLKLLRRFLDDELQYRSPRVINKGYFRYFIISEFGPYSFRPHYHFLIFCQSQEVSSALLEGALYKNWQMCSEDRFYPYCHLCDSGASGYVTQYLTSFSSLPKVYKEVKDLRPFRLASKSPAIGYIEQDKAKIYQDIERGIIKYTRPIARLESSSILSYPADYLATLFPKCREFGKMDDSRRLLVYGYLYRATRKYGYSYYLLSARLRQVLSSQDYLATCACFRFCTDYVASPDYYYFLLDSYYYKLDMDHLRSFYESQQNVDFYHDPQKIFEYYPNIEVLSNDSEMFDCLDYVLSPLGYDVSFIMHNKEFFRKIRRDIWNNNRLYRNQVSDIVDNMVKVSKFNELTGNAPTSV